MTEHFDDLFPLYRLYHKNQHALVDASALDERTTADEWTTGQYKSYERRDAIAAPAERPDDEFLAALRSRASVDDVTTARPVRRAELFAVLEAAYGVDPETGTRPVASGGQLYPLECYPLVLESPDLDAGLYHYNPVRNALEQPADPAYVEERFGPLETFVADNWAHIDADHAVSVVLLLTGIPSRSAAKYGERGYLFTLVEAGEVLHATQLAAAHLGIGSRPYAGVRYDAVADLLGVADDEDEWVLPSTVLAGQP